MESVSSFKKHRKLRTPEGDFDFDDPSTTSLNHSETSQVLQKCRAGRLNPEKVAWILAGCIVSYFSNIYNYILPHQWPKSTWKLALFSAYFSFACFAILFIYLNYYLRYARGIKITAKYWKRDAPISVPASTISGLLGFLFLFIGFFPLYRIWSFLIFSILFMSFFAFISLF